MADIFGTDWDGDISMDESSDDAVVVDAPGPADATPVNPAPEPAIPNAPTHSEEQVERELSVALHTGLQTPPPEEPFSPATGANRVRLPNGVVPSEPPARSGM